MNIQPNSHPKLIARLALGTVGLLSVLLAALYVYASSGGGGVGAVSYNIPQQMQQGNMPYAASYTLLITSPSGLPVGNYPVNLDLSILTTPGGVTASQALSFVSISSNTVLTGGSLASGPLGPLVGSTQLGAAQISFSGPNQAVAVTITTEIPLGDWAGAFAYQIRTSGWASNLAVSDPSAFINNTVSFPVGMPALPDVKILAPVDESIYTWVAGSPPVEIPYSFVGSTPDGSPLVSMNATLNGDDLGITPAGLNQPGANATASGSIFASAPGVYVLAVTDANALGVDTTSVQFLVNVQAGPPSVLLETPDPDGTDTFTLTLGGSVDVSGTFTGISQYGGVTGLFAWLDGNPVSVVTNEIGNLTAHGVVTLHVVAPGVHTFAVEADDNFGAASASTTFTANAVAPHSPPIATITSPRPNSCFTMDRSGVISLPGNFTGVSSTDPITALAAMLDGRPVTVSASGLGKLTAYGAASLRITSTGKHHFSVTATNAVGTASAAVDFTVSSPRPPKYTTCTGDEWRDRFNRHGRGYDDDCVTWFNANYPKGLEVGISGDRGRSIQFKNTSGDVTTITGSGRFKKSSTAHVTVVATDALCSFFDQNQGHGGQLEGDMVNPNITPTGIFGSQVVALRLNIDFNDAGFSALIIRGTGTTFDGLTILQAQAAFESVLGGAENRTRPSLSNLAVLAACLNSSFDGGSKSSWANLHLAN